jgi:FxsC-like protein
LVGGERIAMDPEPKPKRTYFFLSYAHRDDRPNAGRFFQDLSREIRRRAGLPEDAVVGFMDDHDIPVGAEWRDEVARAIATTSCFVPLISPHYLESEVCVSEFQAYWERIERFHARATHLPRSATLLPIRWRPCELPAEIADLQATPLAMSVAYRNQGLVKMMRRRRDYAEDYQNLLVVLADRIVRLSEDLPVEEPLVLSALNNPPRWFVARSWQQQTRARHVYLVVASDSRARMASVRRDVTFHTGQSFKGWQPYHPKLPNEIGMYSYFLAMSRGFDSLVVGVDGLEDLVSWASRHRQIVVVIVDTWAIDLPRHEVELRNYDGVTAPATAVLVPFSDTDAETREHTPQLRSKLIAIFPERHRNPDFFRSDIETHEAFSESLIEVLYSADRQLLEERSPPDGPLDLPPLLSGP